MRTLRDSRLDTPTARASLKVRGKPYWRLLEPGLHLGYRRLKGRPGTWVRRRYLTKQRYSTEGIGTADDNGHADGVTVLSFKQAQEKARGRPTAKTGPYTVRDAIADKFATGTDARRRCETAIIPVLGDHKCDALTESDITTWMKNLADRPPHTRTGKGAKQNYRKFDSADPEAVRRRQNTVNRQWTLLRAALNYAFDKHKIASDAEWRRVKPFKNVEKARAEYLETAAATRLINACDSDFRLLVQAALQTGCRFSELARLVASDFHVGVATRLDKSGKPEEIEIGTVSIRQSKSGKSRHVVLTDEGIALFKSWTAGRNNSDLIFRTNSGQPWKATQKPMAAACKRASIKPAISFHILRHTWASLAVMNGVPLIVVAKNLGHSDTRMVEKHYGHLSQNYITEAIRAGAPRFGIEPDNKVASIR